MKKYRIKTYVSLLENIRYGIDERFLFFFWMPVTSFVNREEAVKYLNKLDEKL